MHSCDHVDSKVIYLSCLVLVSTVAPLVELYGGASDFHKSRLSPTQRTHTNDITIHFRTAKEDGVIFSTSNTADDGHIKAFLREGHAIVSIDAPGAGSVSRQCITAEILNDYLRATCVFIAWVN
jgi:hypothetical protein